MAHTGRAIDYICTYVQARGLEPHVGRLRALLTALRDDLTRGGHLAGHFFDTRGSNPAYPAAQQVKQRERTSGDASATQCGLLCLLYRAHAWGWWR